MHKPDKTTSSQLTQYAFSYSLLHFINIGLTGQFYVMNTAWNGSQRFFCRNTCH